MKNAPEFVTSYLSQAKALIQSEAVKEPVFSRGTYQFEVKEGKATFYPFLAISDQGVPTDAFCTCKVSELGQGCPHLAAAYLRLYNGHQEPLHVRFSKSFWNHLFQMAGKLFGYSLSRLKLISPGKYECISPNQQPLFSIEALDPLTQKLLEVILSQRPVETEESSLKFFNLPPQELDQYRANKPSEQLQYELSFWSDLAKWCLVLDENKQPYEITYDGPAELVPQTMTIQFSQLRIAFFKIDWPSIIPSLNTVKSALQVIGEGDEGIERVEYDPASTSLHIHKKIPNAQETKKGIAVGDWLFVPSIGFYRRRFSPLLQSGEVGPDKIAEVISSGLLQSHLPIAEQSVPARYHLSMDEEGNLHIALYVKQVGDLNGNGALFPPYVYTPAGLFIPLTDLLFDEKETVILRDQVPDFVSQHRLWLNNFPGFQIHLGSLEAHLAYHVTAEEGLRFDAELNFPEQLEESIDFQEWVYIKSSGFYMKKANRGPLPLHPGLVLKKEEVSSFIHSHKDELEQVQGFFASDPIILRLGLLIGLNAEAQIFLEPKMELFPGIERADVKLFGDYVYVKSKGFAEVPLNSRLPLRYFSPSIIPSSQEAAFLAYELEPLRPFILEIDPSLKKPVDLQLKIRKIQRDRKRRTGEWLVDLIYESESGSVDIFTLYDSFYGRKKHLFSAAGLLSLKESRFNWLRGLSKRRLDRKRGMLRLSTLEWIRLSVFEELTPPKGNDPESKETRQLLEELQRFETHRLLDISLLKSQLRPYQETGLQWLWFLYCHGLSGLLCDDMGLGKTHQAMALLAAIIHEDKDGANKYLVVCPTSVIYHWQELLKKFLPHLRVCTYYGISRSLDHFEEEYDLLLTSYGILRTGRENLRTSHFELAIFDEIQIAKNSASQTHQALRTLSAKMRLGLSGTPIENRLRELKSLLDVVLPGYMPPEAIFREMFVTPIEKNQDPGKKKLLSKLVKPFILRRKKSEVLLDLPEKIEEIAYCDLSPLQKELYIEVAQTLKNTIFKDLTNSAKPVSYVHVFSALSKLKRICDHPALVTGEIKKYREQACGKWDLFVELLAEAKESGQKVVIFSQYLEMLEIIEMHLKKQKIGFATIKGSTRDRADQLRKFREDPECEVFTASLLAAGVGIDLTVASIVIHYDRWWNPAKENQATDRVHRIGQNRGVQVFKLVTKLTIEEHIHELIERKKGLIEDVIGSDEIDNINYLSRDELIQVFQKIFKAVE